MAYVADFTTKSSATRVANLDFAAADFPDHSADDYLVLGITTEADGVALTFAVSGWTQIGSTVGSSTTATGLYSCMFYIKCTGSTHTASVVITGATAAIHIHAFLIKDADTTTFLDGTPSAAYVATATAFNSATITTAVADSLILYYLGVDSTTTTPTACHSDPSGSVHFIDNSDNGGASTTASSKVMASGAAGWYIQRTAGATPTPGWKLSLTGVTNRFTVGIKNKTGGRVPAYIDNSAVLGSIVMQGNRFATSALNGESFPTSRVLTVSSASLTNTADAGAVIVDAGLNPYSAAINSTPTASNTSPTGFEVSHTSTDMTTGWIVGAFMASTSKMAMYNQGDMKKGGTFLVIASGTTAGNYYRSFKMMSRDNQDGNGTGFATFSVQPNQTQTQWAQGTNAPSISTITRTGLFHMAHNATGAFYYPEIQFIVNVIAAGGDTTYPVDAAGLAIIGSSSRLQLIKKVGAAELMAYVPIQIGGGDAINIKLTAGALQFPRIYSVANKEINYHGSDNSIGISLAGKSGDVIYIGDGYVITSASPYYFNINASATNAASWYLTGLVIVKANVTLRNVMTFTGISFADCPSLNFSGCTMTDCKVSGVPATNDSLTLDSSSSITSSAFDVSKVTAGNYFVSMADPTKFANCTFKGGGGHAIRISTLGAPATFNFNGLAFTGFGANTTDGAAILNNSGRAVTINVTGTGGTTPTYKNLGAGSSTTVNNTVILTLTGLVNLSDISILTAGTTTEVANVQGNSGSTYEFSYTYATGAYIDIGVFLAGYRPYYVRAYLLGATNSSLPVAQVADRDYIA